MLFATLLAGFVTLGIDFGSMFVGIFGHSQLNLDPITAGVLQLGLLAFALIGLGILAILDRASNY